VCAPDAGLDEFETKLLTLIAQGHSLGRVARAVAMSDSTLRRRLVDIQRRLGANSRVNAIYIATKRGLI
jgi:DNA-binding NarL/FixJ family response regulator